MKVDGLSDSLFRTFFLCILNARHVSPFEISCAKVANGDSNCRMNLN
nr:MAG TPA: hypothetical protein [Caudoviricetes sp.]